MSRLFWRFFATIWITLLLVNVAVGAFIWLHRSAELEQRQFHHPGEPPAFMLGIAASLLQNEGEEALKQLLRDWQRHWPETIYAVDGEGRDLLGRDLPRPILEQARQGVEAGKPGPWRQVQRPHSAASLLLFMPDAPLHAEALLPPPPPREGPPGPGPGRPGGPPPPMPWIAIASGLVASLLCSALLAWAIVGPIQRLRQGFREVGAGRLETRMGQEFRRRRDEIGELGQEFDAMAQQLEALMAAQRRLFHDVSHELRSPLARLQAAVGLAHQDPQRLTAALERIERETQRLDEMVDELLTLARLESGTSGPLEEEVEAAALLRSIADDAAFEAEARGCRVLLQDELGEAPCLLRGRAELLGRALENVVRNAIKYTAPDSVVDIRAWREDARTLALRVGDQGPGVPEEELEAIFMPFFRGAEREQQRGYGLGLAIARRAIEAHGGQVVAGNRPTGGLQVDIHLPLLA